MRLTKAQAKLIQWERVARVATVGAAGMPHLVPVCQLLLGGKIYFASGKRGRKVLNLRANAKLALTVDLYSDDWDQIQGVMVQGTARVIERARASGAAPAPLRKVSAVSARGGARESDSVIVELTPTHVFSW